MTTSPAPVALAIGDEMPSSQFGPLTRSHIVRYAGSGGDFNPIHHDEEFARAAGMPGVFGMGLLHGGVLAQRLTAWVGLANIRSFRIRFTGQVWPGTCSASAAGSPACARPEGTRWQTSNSWSRARPANPR
ncbi:MaoC-like dehydratase [Mycobacteroides abscessus]|nr:MaoC-like dehydratase [Mycobacteroides abscessus]